MRVIKFRAWVEKEQKLKPIDNMDLPVLMNKGTIMQYTGLLDKNGQEICEGDIVTVDRLDSFSAWNEAIIMYSDIHASFLLQYTKEAGGILIDCSRITSKDKKTIFGHIYEWKIEVIGNIYESEDDL